MNKGREAVEHAQQVREYQRQAREASRDDWELEL